MGNPLGRALVVTAALAALALAGAARADGSRFGPHDVRTLFAIGKNLDRNEVQYGIRLDANCMPVGKEPVYAYWRQYEEGPEVTEDLNFLDRTAYGIKGQWVVERTPDKSKVLIEIKATSDRPVAIITRKVDGKCRADSIAKVNGAPAHLERVFVHVAGFLSVDWIEIKGVGVASGKPVIEHVKH